MSFRLFVFASLISLLGACAHAPQPSPEAPQGCGGGDATSCQELAERILDGAPAEKVRPHADELRGGCDRGIADACAGTGLLELREDLAQGLSRVQRACNDGSSIGCAAWIEARVRSGEDSDDAARAREEAIALCDKLGGSVCFTAATMSYPAEQEPEAMASLKRACDTGSAYGCYVQGMMSAERDDAEGARALYEKGCAREVPEACFNLGYQLLEGTGGPADPARARQLIGQACAGGDPSGCDLLAATNDLTVGPDEAGTAYATPEEAAAKNRTYCEAGGANACVDAAFILGDRAEKTGQLEGMEDVLSLLQTGCGRRVMRACNVLGHVVRDADQSCDSGVAGQCLVIGYAYQQGVELPGPAGPGVRKDPERARAAFEKACAGGVPGGCARAK